MVILLSSAFTDHSIFRPASNPNCSTIHIGMVVLRELLLPPVDTSAEVDVPFAMSLAPPTTSKRSLKRSIINHVQ